MYCGFGCLPCADTNNVVGNLKHRAWLFAAPAGVTACGTAVARCGVSLQWCSLLCSLELILLHSGYPRFWHIFVICSSRNSLCLLLLALLPVLWMVCHFLLVVRENRGCALVETAFRLMSEVRNGEHVESDTSPAFTVNQWQCQPCASASCYISLWPECSITAMTFYN